MLSFLISPVKVLASEAYNYPPNTQDPLIFIKKTATYVPRLDNKEFSFPIQTEEKNDSSKSFEKQKAQEADYINCKNNIINVKLIDGINFAWYKGFYLCSGTIKNIGKKLIKDVCITVKLYDGKQIIGSYTGKASVKIINPDTESYFLLWIRPYDNKFHNNTTTKYSIDCCK